MSDLELQRKLAELLPDKVSISDNGAIHWQNRSPSGGFIRPSEWLHACWLIEQTFDGTGKASAYAMQLKHEISPDGFVGDYRFVTASWQQRAKAILAIKPPPLK